VEVIGACERRAPEVDRLIAECVMRGQSTRKKDRPRVKCDLDRVMNAPALPQARSGARRFADAWRAEYPRAAACLRADLDALFEHHRFDDPGRRKAARSTNAIERCLSKCAGEPGPWASWPTARTWIASGMPCSRTSTGTRALQPRFH
jgi:transposase-like protein